MTSKVINPESLGAPKGYSHGVLGPEGGRVLYVAGQPGWDATESGPVPGFAEQFARALDRVLAVVREAGGRPEDVARMTVYVTDLDAYRAALEPLGREWRARFDRRYPAMAMVQVAGLVDEGAVVEIEATAVIGGTP
jgi:enamine deaminase RidA (YjgF/YER057c/UK114 family)